MGKAEKRSADRLFDRSAVLEPPNCRTPRTAERLSVLSPDGVDLERIRLRGTVPLLDGQAPGALLPGVEIAHGHPLGAQGLLLPVQELHEHGDVAGGRLA